jgi:hypothetical protein
MRIATAATVLFGLTWFALQPDVPIKMGLWELTTTSTMKGSGKMADAMRQSGHPVGTPTTESIKMCFTPDNWQNSIGGMVLPGCTRSNLVMSGQKYSVTLTCTHGTTTTAVDTAIFFDSPVQLHGTAHIVRNSSDDQIVNDGVTTAKFLSADCGDVKPILAPHH